MHDPLVVAFEIPRPWPQRSRSHDAKPGKPRWTARYQWATWRKPFTGWRRFWTIAGKGWYWPSLITVWHREPGGHDSGEICHHSSRWRWHIHHWRIQIRPVQALHRWLFERCELCGRRYPYGYAPVSHQWDQPRASWWRVTRRAYHHECSLLINTRLVKERTEELVRRLFAEIRVRTDESEAVELLERLTSHTNHAWDFHLRHRLTTLLGYERDDDYKLAPRR